MTTREEIEEKLRAAPKVIGHTAVTLYDCSYPILLHAGRFVRTRPANSGVAYRRNLAVLALGLAGWNQGSKSAWHAEPLIRNIAALTQFLKAVERLKQNLERSFERESASAGLMAVLKAGGKVIGLVDSSTRISVLSKLLHFLSPQHFVIYDTNVAKGFGGKPNQRDYKSVQLTLWALGFHRDGAPDDESLARYWSGVSRGASPMRLVDCTFYQS